MEEFRKLLSSGKDVAFVFRKGALTDAEYKNETSKFREETIQLIVKASGENPIISTTGKAVVNSLKLAWQMGRVTNTIS